MTARRTDTPWGLTAKEQKVLDLVCLTGCQTEAAKTLGLNRVTVAGAIKRARIRMQATTTLKAVLEWDRFAMGRDESEAT